MNFSVSATPTQTLPRLGYAWEDLDVFFDLDEFAETVVLTGAGNKVVKAIFNDPYVNAHAGQYEADTGKPHILLQEKDIYNLNVRRGMPLHVRGKSYSVATSPQRDGTGLVILEIVLDGDAL
jgi:hypothetical protein